MERKEGGREGGREGRKERKEGRMVESLGIDGGAIGNGNRIAQVRGKIRGKTGTKT